MWVLFCVAGCVSEARHQETISTLTEDVDELEMTLQTTQDRLQSLTEQEEQTRMESAEQIALLRTDLQESLARLPEELVGLCPQSVTELPVACEDTQPVQTIVMAEDKMVLGELERVWLDPPGATLIARIDTGANSSSLHADEMIGFERDGDDWVRFNVFVDDSSIPVEAKVARYVRVYQQADADGSRRPVVRLRVRLGDVQDTFEFTLADRAHLEYQILLGRNFLTDIALVDVGKQFVQRPYQPGDE
jgi:hypothetical protein